MPVTLPQARIEDPSAPARTVGAGADESARRERDEEDERMSRGASDGMWRAAPQPRDILSRLGQDTHT